MIRTKKKRTSTFKNFRSVIIVGVNALRHYHLGIQDGVAKILDSQFVDLDDMEHGMQRGMEVLLSHHLQMNNLVLVLSDHAYRTQMEFLPQAARKHSVKALEKLIRLEPHEFLLTEKLAQTTSRGSPTQAWQATAIRADLVDQITSVLDRRKIKVKKIYVDQDLTKAAAVQLSGKRSADADALFVSVAEESLDLTYVVGGVVASTRHIGISIESDIAKKVASEIRRTNVFFHRKFPATVMNTAYLHVQMQEMGEAIAEEVKIANQLDEVHLVEAARLGALEDVDVRSSDLTCIQWLETLKKGELSRLENIQTPSKREKISRSRFAPMLVTALVLFCGLSFWYLVALESDISNRRMLLAARTEEVTNAKRILTSWAEADRLQEGVVTRATEIDDLLCNNIDVSTALKDVASYIPSDVLVELFEMSRILPDTSSDEPTKEGWHGRIVFTTNRNYFESRELIDATRQALKRTRFLRQSDLDLRILSESMPWKEQHEKEPSCCRFAVDFWTERS